MVKNKNETANSNKASGIAITCGLLGFSSCLIFGIFTGLPSLILGHTLLMRIKKEPEKYSALDKKLIICGLFLSYIGILMSLVFGLNVWQLMRT